MSQDPTAPLGAHVVDGGTWFRLSAPHARRVQLVLLDGYNQREVEMESWGDEPWHVFVEGVGQGQHYGFRVHGAWSPAEGIRTNPSQLLLDPRARAITGGIDYNGPVRDYLARDNWRPDTSDSANYVPHSVVVADSPAPHTIARRTPMAESVIYELHVRGFTKTHPLVPEHLRGTYAGLVYPPVLEHFIGLGITAVELLPIYHFISEEFVARKGLTNYWGYNPLGLFAPHAAYAQRDTVAGQVQEFKDMVSAFHRAGIEVLLDVVYNHTAESGHDGPTLSLRGIDQPSYYRLTNDHQGDYDTTGCGNSVNTAMAPAQELVLDSLRYWVQEMGVDGFRFDLATTLMRDENHHVTFAHPLKRALDTDPAFEGIKMIAEPWDLGPDGYQVGSWGPRWSEWNDRFRDHARDYWRGSTFGVQELATRLSGSPDIFDAPGRTPAASVNYVTAHDGFTMRDLVSYDVKHNLDNGESNRDGTDNNRSYNHGWEGETEDPQINELRRRQVLNMMGILLLADGTPMITAGDDMGRTQLGNNNAYCQDSPVSWLDWDVSPQWQQVHQRVADLIHLRRQHPLLRCEAYRYHQEIIGVDGEGLERVDLTWMDGSNGQMGEHSWHDAERTLLGMYNSDASDAWLSWFHCGIHPKEITLPRLPWAITWEVIWTSANDGELPSGQLLAGASVMIPARCVVLMRATVPTTAAELRALKAAAQ